MLHSIWYSHTTFHPKRYEGALEFGWTAAFQLEIEEEPWEIFK